MVYLAYFIISFSIIQLLVSLVNLLFQSKIVKSTFKVSNRSLSLVSVLIPARNEEKHIANLLLDLQQQAYSNIEILVFNDLSTDRTTEIVEQFRKNDSRIKLINSKGLPDGWLGKNFGCYSMAVQAKGDFLLFLDADVRINSDIIVNTKAQLKAQKLGLLTIFPKQIMISLGERITVPNMNYILLSLLPLVLVRKAKDQSLAAANGQFMLFDSILYKKMEPHKVMKANKVEDIEIARFYKQNNIPVACLVGDDTITCRMYEGFGEGVNGFSKNVISFFGNSFFMAILFWAITTFGFIPVVLALPSFLPIYLLLVISTRVIISVVSNQSIIQNLLLLIPQQLALGVFIYQAFTNKIKKQYQWKGRSIS